MEANRLVLPESSHRDQDAVVAGLLHGIRNARFAAGVACVRCGCSSVRRWGRFGDRQRYRCNACRRTFSDLTGTPAAYLKRLGLLPNYRECLQAALSVRASARRVGVHPTTSFRWRHLLLRGMMPFDLQRLRGAVEIDDGWVLCANTVSRDRPGRHPAWRPRRSLADPAQRRSWIVALCDRSARSTLEPAGFRRPGLEFWHEVLSDFVEPGSVVITRRGRLGSEAQAARGCGLAVTGARLPRAEHAVESAATGRARELLCRVRQWLRRFRGIATHYLSSYLYWYGLLDIRRRTAVRLTQMLRWPLTRQIASARA